MVRHIPELVSLHIQEIDHLRIHVQVPEPERQTIWEILLVITLVTLSVSTLVTSWVTMSVTSLVTTHVLVPLHILEQDNRPMLVTT